MIIYQDVRELDPIFPFEIEQRTLKNTENCEDSYHWHNFCEITYVRKGKGNYFVNGMQYEMKQGDLIIFNNVEPHGWLVQDVDMQVTVMIFSMEFVSDVNNDYLKPFIERGSNFMNKISSEDAFVSEITIIIDELFREYQHKQQGYQLLIKADVLRLLTFLIRNFQNVMEKPGKSEKLSDKNITMKRLEDAFHYINSHYAEKITLGEVARSVYLSENYFSAYFKKVTNQSFMDYLTGLRLKKAYELMKSTDRNMIDIAMECGFNNMSNFYRMYKKHMGMLPKRH